MDQSRFDAIVRALAGNASRRSALALLAGLAAGVGAGTDTIGKRRCRRDSPPGQCCRKRQGTIRCICTDGGTPCGDACCAADERCEQGACVTVPPEPACIPLGEPCKGVGRPCCAGLGCGSGQGGLDDVACYAQAGDPCRRTADCAYNADCLNGTCVQRPPCPSGQALCGETCRYLDSDPLACGACGAACPINETCAGGQCACIGFDGTLETWTCCANGAGWMKSVYGAFQCTPATAATDCYQGWTCCDGRCCATCSTSDDCGEFGMRCCDGRCRPPDPNGPGCEPDWAYAMPDRCEAITGQPCPAGFTACEGKNSDTYPYFDEAPGWVCCPGGTGCDRERGVCLQE